MNGHNVKFKYVSIMKMIESNYSPEQMKQTKLDYC